MESERVVVITGAGGGIGAELVGRFRANGDTVIATDMNEEALGELPAGDGTGELITSSADISNERDCAELAELAAEQGGRVDVLINCAGFFPIQPFEEMSLEEWQKVIDINLTGTFLMTKAMLPLMKDHGWGRIINYGSGSVFVGVPGQAHYVAAKAGIVGFSRSLAREVGGYGITVNILAPGLTLTGAVVDSFPPEVLEAQRESRALNRDQQPEDLVGATFYLASPDADFVSGQTINVDGGNYMN